MNLSSPGWSETAQEVRRFSVHVTVNGVQLSVQYTGKQLTQRSLPTSSVY